MGVSGSGKSEIGKRLAARLGVMHIEGDDFHPAANVEKMRAGIPLSDQDRHGWLLNLQSQIRQAREQGRGLVLSCSALKRRYRNILRGGDPDLAFIHLDGPRDLIAARMQARRGHFMPAALLDSQFRDLEPLQPGEKGFRGDISLDPETLVNDILRQFDAMRGKPDNRSLC
jgi:gluconokinase